MPQTLVRPKSKSKKPTYRDLLKEVRKTIALGKQRAQKAVEREKVRTVWETGTLIRAHILQHRGRADYGAKTLKRLGRDLQVSQAELSYMVQFAEVYRIYPSTDILSWGHYRELLSINDGAKLRLLAAKAGSEVWTQKRLRSEVRKVKGLQKGRRSFASLRMTDVEGFRMMKPGKPGVYRTLKAVSGIHQGKLIYDLGFANYYRPKSKREQARLLRHFVPRNDSSVIARASKKPEASFGLSDRRDRRAISESDLYFYEAWVTAVIDGDTFWADVHLGFGVTTAQSLRFRSINARELPSKAGVRAKKYLARKISRQKILIRTSKSDQYDRYLVDVWLLGGAYLNQTLVKKGHAQIVS